MDFDIAIKKLLLKIFLRIFQKDMRPNAGGR